jgi:ribosomal protein L11 methyltransferase
MVALAVECAAAEAEARSMALWDAGACGIQEEDLPGGRVRLRAFFDVLSEGVEGDVEEVEDLDWEQAARDAWTAFPVGERLWLAPEWDAAPAPDGRLKLVIHPGLALGTGAHPATQLALTALEEHLRPGESLFDTGTGTGILMAAARLLGARTAWGCDLDWEGLRFAAEKGASNLFAGSLRAVRDGAADWLVANINAATHRLLRHDYARIARRALVLSGQQRGDEFPAPPGFSPVDKLIDGEWECLVLCKDDRFSR